MLLKSQCEPVTPAILIGPPLHLICQNLLAFVLKAANNPNRNLFVSPCIHVWTPLSLPHYSLETHALLYWHLQTCIPPTWFVQTPSHPPLTLKIFSVLIILCCFKLSHKLCFEKPPAKWHTTIFPISNHIKRDKNTSESILINFSLQISGSVGFLPLNLRIHAAFQIQADRKLNFCVPPCHNTNGHGAICSPADNQDRVRL